MRSHIGQLWAGQKGDAHLGLRRRRRWACGCASMLVQCTWIEVTWGHHAGMCNSCVLLEGGSSRVLGSFGGQGHLVWAWAWAWGSEYDVM